MRDMATPEEPPGDIPELFGLERSRLVELLATVGESDWHRPSPCPEWTVLGLCAHLAGTDLSLLARHRDHYLGTPSPDGLTETEFIEWLDELQMEWVRGARRLSPRLVTDLLAWTGPQVVDALRRIEPMPGPARVSWAGPDGVPGWLDQVRELSECWIHRQQLLQALGRAPDLRPELAGPILEGLRWAYPFRLQQIRAEPGDTVSIDIAGPVSATWQLVADPSGWNYQSGPGSRVVASLSMTTDEAWRLLTNNLAPADQERLRVSGDARVVEVLRRTRAIIGSPR